MTAPMLRRLVLELAHGPIDPGAMRLAAEFARDFGLDLFGVYTEDESLLRVAELPFTREIRLLTHDWHKLDPGAVVDELRSQAETVRRHLREMTDRLGVRGGFEVRRGDPVLCVAGVCSPADAIVVSASTTIQRPVADRLRQAAEQSPAAVLVMPNRLTRNRGPVVVVTDALDDPGVALARGFAERQHVRLLILMPEPDGVAPRRDQDGRDQDGRDQDITPIAAVRTEDVLRALAPVRERLVVITHGCSAAIGIEGASRIAETGAVPVLAL